MRRYLLVLAAPLLAAGSQPPTVLKVEVEKVRNSRGLIHACLTRDPSHFPDCRGDPTALKQTVSAGTAELRFTSFDPGSYALTMFHDENANDRLDTFLGVPKEGFGFSRNPVIRISAPRFNNVRIDLEPGVTRTPVRMQYIL